MENKFTDKFISGRREWSDGDYNFPKNPEEVDWDGMYPNRDTKQVEILDIGCAFAGFLISISPLVPELCLGVEIRDKVASYSQQRILHLRKESPGQYENIWVERSNAMKYLPNYFKKGQLAKITIMFPDPNVKYRNHKKRIVGSSLVPIYAYILRKGGLLYTITDVQDLSVHMCKYLDESPLFRKLKPEEYKDDPLVAQMDKSEDAKHQKRKEKWIAIYEKIY